jgi:hypothetical protein
LPSNTTIAAFAPTVINGLVFQDFNNDGQITANGIITDTGVSGVTVTAYDTTGASVGSAVTDSNGNYTIDPGAASGPYRVVFSDLPAGYELAASGGQTGTTVQFITTAAAATNVNLGVLEPINYCQSDPLVAVPRLRNGDPTDVGNAAATGLFGVSYYNYTSQTPATLATVSQLGSTWGVAWQRETQQLYTAAVVKRNTGLGSGGLGGIYMTRNPATAPATSLFVDLDAAPFNLSLGALPDNSTRGLGFPTAPSLDLAAFAATGKQGLGDIDLSEDGNTLWSVNLNNRSLVQVDVTAGVTPDAGGAGAGISLGGYERCAGMYERCAASVGAKVGQRSGLSGGRVQW